MYAMSWEIDSTTYKYESIQDNYYVESDEYDIDKDLSLEQLLEDEENELLELEGEQY